MYVRIGETERYPVYYIEDRISSDDYAAIELTDEEFKYVRDIEEKYEEMQDKVKQWMNDLRRAGKM